jgi:hypothetical protein
MTPRLLLGLLLLAAPQGWGAGAPRARSPLSSPLPLPAAKAPLRAPAPASGFQDAQHLAPLSSPAAALPARAAGLPAREAALPAPDARKTPAARAQLAAAESRPEGAARRFDGAAVSAAPAAPADEAPALAETENGVVLTPSLAAGLAALRAASHPMTPEAASLIRTLAAHHPGLPLSPERVFLIKDRATLAALGLPEDAGGAARLLSDGANEIKVVLLAAVQPLSYDEFVEFSIHEAVHLADEGILRLPHDAGPAHWLAEGWTQLRSHAMANRSLELLGRPPRSGWQAYTQEVELVQRFAERHGSGTLDALVRSGDERPLRAALGTDWDFVKSLWARHQAGERVRRARFLEALTAIARHDGLTEGDRRAVTDFLWPPDL